MFDTDDPSALFNATFIEYVEAAACYNETLESSLSAQYERQVREAFVFRTINLDGLLIEKDCRPTLGDIRRSHNSLLSFSLNESPLRFPHIASTVDDYFKETKERGNAALNTYFSDARLTSLVPLTSSEEDDFI